MPASSLLLLHTTFVRLAQHLNVAADSLLDGLEPPGPKVIGALVAAAAGRWECDSHPLACKQGGLTPSRIWPANHLEDIRLFSRSSRAWSLCFSSAFCASSLRRLSSARWLLTSDLWLLASTFWFKP